MIQEGNLFIMAWDCNGLEAVVNITEHEKEATWANLLDKEAPK